MMKKTSRPMTGVAKAAMPAAAKKPTKKLMMKKTSRPMTGEIKFR
jgi:hypothetical protein